MLRWGTELKIYRLFYKHWTTNVINMEYLHIAYTTNYPKSAWGWQRNSFYEEDSGYIVQHRWT